MPELFPETKRKRRLFLLIAGLGLLLRFGLSVVSFGTNDVHTWYRFATSIDQDGLWQLYAQDSLFNHPPLGAFLVVLFYKLSEALSSFFPFFLRFPGIIAEAGTLWLMWVIPRESGATSRGALQIVAVYALSLISITISGYHGNTDPVFIFFLLFSMYLLEIQKRPFLAGVSFALAVSIKIIPLLFFPLLFLRCTRNNDRGKFLLGALFAAPPFLYGVVAGGEPFLTNIFHYASVREYWGFQMFLLLSQNNHPEISLLTELSQLYDSFLGRGAIIFFALFVALLNLSPPGKTQTIFLSAAMTSAVFGIFAPGIGIQYFAFFAPFFCLSSPRWGFRFCLLAGLCSVCLYYAFLTSLFPLASVHTGTAPKGVVFLYFLLWLLLVVFSLENGKKLLRHHAEASPNFSPTSSRDEIGG